MIIITDYSLRMWYRATDLARLFFLYHQNGNQRSLYSFEWIATVYIDLSRVIGS